MADRAIVTRLRAEVGQYLDSMKKAGDATGRVGDEGQKAAEKLQKALSRQEAAAKSLEAAEGRLAAAKKSSTTSSSALAAAEAGVIRARQADADATSSLTSALASAREESTKSTSRLGSLAEVAARNEQAWTRAGAVFTGVGAGITALGLSAAKTGIDYNTLQQTSRAALTSLLGSAQAANAQMDKLDEFARTSPFSKATFISAQQQMLAFGIEAQKVVPYLDAIQNAVAASGGSNDDIAGIVATMSKVQSSAKITAEDLNELGNRGVNAAELIGSQMGMTGAEVRSAITKGSLDAGQALDALAAGMSERFDGAADNVKNTFAGAVDRVKAAWRDLGSALAEPLVGKNGGGALTGLLNELADAMRAVEDLPGPLKTAAVGLTGLLGAGSVAAGGFLLLAPRIAETRQALSTLRNDMPRTSAAFGKLATGAKFAAGAFTALAVAQAASAALRDNDVASVESFTGALLDLSDAAKGQASGKQLESLAGSQLGLLDEQLGGVAASLLEVKNNSAGLSKVADGLAGVVGLEDQKGANSLKAIDDALAGMVRSGNLDEAASGFKYLEERGKLVGVSTKDLTKLLPSYSDSLKALDNEQRLAGDGAKTMGKAVALSAEDLKKAQDAMKEADENARRVGESFVNLGDSLNDPKVSLQDWISELEKQSKALEEFQRNAARAQRRGLDEGLVQELENQGTAGAMRLEQLANASDEQIARVSRAWREGQSAVDDYRDSVNLVPPEILTEFQASGAEDAIDKAVEVADEYNLTPKQVETALRALNYTDAEINKVQRRMRDVNGTTATVQIRAVAGQANEALNDFLGRIPLFRTINLKTSENADGGLYVGGIKARAGGGFDEYGRRVKREPQMRQSSQGAVLWGEPETGWEAYISGKPGMKRRNQDIASQAVARLGGVATFADGGMVEAAGRLETLRMRIRVRDLERSLRELEEYGEPDKKTKKRKKRLRLRGMDRLEARYELTEARREFADTLRANNAARRAGMSPSRYNSYRQERADQRRELKQERAQAASEYLDNASIKGLSTPAQVEQSLARSIADMATLTSLLIELKRKGAAPWLLQQLQSAGPSKSAIRLARYYLSNTAALASVNAQARQLQQVSNIYGQVTADPKWMKDKSWSPALSRGQQAALSKSETTINVALDGDYLSREVARLVQHNLDAGQQRVGVLG